jgi:hypothetical protein
MGTDDAFSRTDDNESTDVGISLTFTSLETIYAS